MPQAGCLQIEIVSLLFIRQLFSPQPLFYLRDPSFIDSIPTKQKDLYSAENYLAKCKISELKERIKSMNLTWRGYRHVDNFACMVKEDLIDQIDQQFKQDSVPTAFELDEMKHLSFTMAYVNCCRASRVGRGSLVSLTHSLNRPIYRIWRSFVGLEWRGTSYQTGKSLPPRTDT